MMKDKIDSNTYNNYKNFLTSLIRTAKNNNFNNFILTHEKNSKAMWSMINSGWQVILNSYVS